MLRFENVSKSYGSRPVLQGRTGRFAPGAYERAYQLYYRRSRSWEWPLRALRRITRRSLLRWTVEVHADAVVSTYALGTLILGEMRARGELTVPLVNFITDFGIHPRTVHPSVDLNLTVHEVATHDDGWVLDQFVRSPRQKHQRQSENHPLYRSGLVAEYHEADPDRGREQEIDPVAVSADPFGDAGEERRRKLTYERDCDSDCKAAQPPRARALW